MNSSRYVGRVGGLAVALGVGGAVLSGVGVAAADTGGQDPSGATSNVNTPAASTARGPARGPVKVKTRPQSGVPAAAAADSEPARKSRAPRPAATTPDLPASATPVDGRAGQAADVASTPVTQRRSGARVGVPTAAAVDRIVAPAGPGPASIVAPAAASTVSPAAVGTLPAPPVAAAVTAVVDPNTLAPKVSLRVLGITALSTTFSFSLAMLNQIAMAIHLGPTQSAFNQTLKLNGFNLVPASTEVVTSLYGPWTYAPGGLNLVQGQQQYNVVDPTTQTSVGTFSALVSSGSPMTLARYSELLVTSAEGNVGTGAGQVPPVGSVIAQMRIIGKFGWSYSALPSPGGTVISAKLTTPFGDISVPFFNKFDASAGIADHTVDNRPIDLGNGYSIAPSDPTGETYTGTSGLLPLFQTVQTTQRFDLRDSSGATVGSFDGVATTTWDALGAYTEAVLVTKSYGDNVGTAPGQVPPPGSVYNVGYTTGNPGYALYGSIPSPYGDVISMIESNGTKVTNVLTWPLNQLDASSPPAVKRLQFAGGYGIMPTSDFIPTGANGLPPRDVQLQGYQSFGIYDPSGVQRGSFDAMVTKQWDLLGISSEVILVTKVNDGTAGTAVGDVPPVGSVINYVNVGTSGFGSSYWSLPSPSGGAKTTFKILTPIIDIPTWSSYNASAGTDTVVFADPPTFV